MLIIIVGPSGSGKTTLMERMCHDYGCFLLENYTTRPLRRGETSRLWISTNEAIQRYKSDEFEFLNSVYGNYYAVTKVAFDKAVGSSESYLFDVHWSHLHKILHKVQCVVFLSDLDRGLLSTRLSAAGRSSRSDHLQEEISGIETVREKMCKGVLREKLVEAGDVQRPGLIKEIIDCASRNMNGGRRR